MSAQTRTMEAPVALSVGRPMPPLLRTIKQHAPQSRTLFQTLDTRYDYEQSCNRCTSFSRTPEDYQAVYDAVALRLSLEKSYDDGSYGPVVLRLGWHCSGTYDAATGTGGSNGATMRFAPESQHRPNSGLDRARNFLERVQRQFEWISYSDLWTLAAVCAVQEMGGPDILWRPGRRDRDARYCTPDGRLPLASKDQNHIRAVFGRMGFNDREMVALSGAHAVGRCHTERSGYEGQWTSTLTRFTNEYFKLLLGETWEERDWVGPRQFQDQSSKSFVMLPTDYCLTQDAEFRQFVHIYAASEDVFFRDFGKAMTKLFELGVPFESEEDARMRFTSIKRSE